MCVHMFIFQGGGVLWSLELNVWFIVFFSALSECYPEAISCPPDITLTASEGSGVW